MLNFRLYNPITVLETNRKIIKTCFTNAKILLAYGGGSIFKNGVHEAVTLALKV
jgi:NADP-dependent alcohol dehydrogenase